jgi:hypothetical protein
MVLQVLSSIQKECIIESNRMRGNAKRRTNREGRGSGVSKILLYGIRKALPRLTRDPINTFYLRISETLK